MHLLQVEPYDGADRLGGDEIEVDRHPVAPLPHLQNQLGVADLELGRIFLGVEIDGEGQLDLLFVLQKRVVRAEQRGLHHVVVRIDLVDLAATDVLTLEGEELGGEVREGARSAQQVGSAHAAELSRGRPRRWEVGWDADDGRLHAALFQHLPEGRAVPQQLHFAAGQGELVLADLENPAGVLGTAGREIGQHGLRVAVDEIEDAVPSGVHAGDEVGPGHRALWRHRSLELREASGFSQAGEIGHAPCRHQALRQLVVQAIEAQDDDLLARIGRGRLASAGNQAASEPAEGQHHRDSSRGPEASDVTAGAPSSHWRAPHRASSACRLPAFRY